MSKQLAKHILMVRPACFGYNQETAKNNVFQNKGTQLSASAIQKKALKEFDQVVEKFRKEKIHVIVAKDKASPKKPDAIFPNNWLTTHKDGSVLTYPMFSPKRRKERNKRFVKLLEKDFKVKKKIQFEAFEKVDLFLEGTGSMILDRENKIAYACESKRTDPTVFKEFCKCMGYKACLFNAVDQAKKPIYHTNVMMSVGADFVMICMDSIRSKKEQKKLKSLFKKTNKTIIKISYKQMLNFAGNTLQVQNKQGKKYLLMSSTAHASLNKKQLEMLAAKTYLLQCPIPTIEYFGGGSLRCMIAEVFLNRK